MRASEILREFKYDPIPENQVEDIAVAAFNSVYPDVKVFAESSDELTSIFTGEDADILGRGYFAGNSDEFYLQVNAYVDDDGGNVIVTDAVAGQYTGAVSVILKALFDQLGADHNTLIIKHDASGGVWERIADKLGVEIQDDRSY